MITVKQRVDQISALSINDQLQPLITQDCIHAHTTTNIMTACLRVIKLYAHNGIIKKAVKMYSTRVYKDKLYKTI